MIAVACESFYLIEKVLFIHRISRIAFGDIDLTDEFDAVFECYLNPAGGLFRIDLVELIISLNKDLF